LGRNFGTVVVRNGLSSFGQLLDSPIRYEDAPEHFYLDLYRKFDLDRILQLSAPTNVVQN